jgi:hypothetical protein
LKSFAVDIDSDELGAKSKYFEDVCTENNLHIDAKVMSGAGYHYYIPYKETVITENNYKDFITKSRNLYHFFGQKGIKLDKKIKDLPRIMRIWGSYNHKRSRMCTLIYLTPASKEQIDNNTNFIDSLKNELVPTITTDIFVSSCLLVDHLSKNKLGKQDTEKNDILLKNAAIFLRAMLGEDGYQIGVDLAELQGHTESEFSGWWRKKEFDKFSCGEMVSWLHRHYPELENSTCAKCRIKNCNKIIYIDDTTKTWQQVKSIARDERKLIINREISMDIFISQGHTNFTTEVVVATIYEYQTEDEGIQFTTAYFDERKPRLKNVIREEEVRIDFYIYEGLDGDVSYLIFSEYPLELGQYKIFGNVVKLKDTFAIGETGKIESKRKGILIHSATPYLVKIQSIEEMFKVFPYSYQDTLDYIFSFPEDKKYIILKEPDWLNMLVVAWLLSGKKLYPLHLLFNGNFGCGKSTIIKAIYSKFPEQIGVTDASTSTIKLLVPSFYGSVPVPGALLSAHRICFTDEFFRIVKSINIEKDVDNRLSAMNNILEHSSNYSYGSGKGVMNKSKMRGKCLFMTNPLTGMTFSESVKLVENSTLSRFLMINLRDDFTEWVTKGDHIVESDSMGVGYNAFLSMYDFMQNIQTKYDLKRILSIVTSHLDDTSEFMRPFYNSRFKGHHAPLLMDGIIKTRCLFEKDASFTADETDYTQFEGLWIQLVEMWQEGKNAVSPERYAFLQLIPDEGIWDYQLKKECEKRQLNYEIVYKWMLKYKYVVVENRKVMKVKEEQLNLNEL